LIEEYHLAVGVIHPSDEKDHKIIKRFQDLFEKVEIMTRELAFHSREFKELLFKLEKTNPTRVSNRSSGNYIFFFFLILIFSIFFSFLKEHHKMMMMMHMNPRELYERDHERLEHERMMMIRHLEMKKMHKSVEMESAMRGRRIMGSDPFRINSRTNCREEEEERLDSDEEEEYRMRERNETEYTFEHERRWKSSFGRRHFPSSPSPEPFERSKQSQTPRQIYEQRLKRARKLCSQDEFISPSTFNKSTTSFSSDNDDEDRYMYKHHAYRTYLRAKYQSEKIHSTKPIPIMGKNQKKEKLPEIIEMQLEEIMDGIKKSLNEIERSKIIQFLKREYKFDQQKDKQVECIILSEETSLGEKTIIMYVMNKSNGEGQKVTR